VKKTEGIIFEKKKKKKKKTEGLEDLLPMTRMLERGF